VPHAFVAAVLQNRQLHLFQIKIRGVNQTPAQVFIKLFQTSCAGISQDDEAERFIISGIEKQDLKTIACFL